MGQETTKPYYRVCKGCKTYEEFTGEDADKIDDTFRQMRSRISIRVTWGGCSKCRTRSVPLTEESFMEALKSGKLEGFTVWDEEAKKKHFNPDRPLVDGEFWCIECRAIHNVRGSRYKILEGMRNNKRMYADCSCGNRVRFNEENKGDTWLF